eukprot:TRINITY_DN104287_c0_g1_i1.p1 TRINITY_DN104287_c0_g1~~TRINITY_DN104287_c0_g1_i1.p1  ORF type:complete len:293 (+),score=34.26 TRINITY_DN104287_c0_g1_i1:75-953(+)
MPMLKLVVGGLLALAAASEPTCLDPSETVDPECHNNVLWALRQGRLDHPDYYPKGATTYSDFLCALYLKVGEEGDAVDRATGVTPAHNCTLPPCTAISEAMEKEGGEQVQACLTSKRETAEPAGEAPSMPWWGWVLITLGVLLAAAAAAWAVMGGRKKAAQKKRSLRVADHAGAPAAPEPVPTTAEPLATYTAPPVYTSVAAPIYTSVTKAPPVITAPPVYVNRAEAVMTAAPMTMQAAPLVAAPVYINAADPAPIQLVEEAHASYFDRADSMVAAPIYETTFSASAPVYRP